MNPFFYTTANLIRDLPLVFIRIAKTSHSDFNDARKNPVAEVLRRILSEISELLGPSGPANHRGRRCWRTKGVLHAGFRPSRFWA